MEDVGIVSKFRLERLRIKFHSKDLEIGGRIIL